MDTCQRNLESCPPPVFLLYRIIIDTEGHEGLMKPRRGSTPIPDKEKLGVGKSLE